MLIPLKPVPYYHDSNSVFRTAELHFAGRVPGEAKRAKAIKEFMP